MVPATKPLFCLTAADVMSTPLTVVPEEMSLKGAAHWLTERGVSGAPVVNKEGCCVGVLTGTDLVRGRERERHGHVACATPPVFCAQGEMAEPGALPDEGVRDYMTRDPVTVAAAVSLGELARKMADVHIHRVIVVDKDGKPIGIVSTTDVLAAVARADQASTTALNGGS